MMEGIEGFRGLRGFSRGGSALGRRGSGVGRGGAGLSRGRSALSRGKDKFKSFFSRGKDKIKSIFGRGRDKSTTGDNSGVIRNKSSKTDRIGAVAGLGSLALGAGGLYHYFSGDGDQQDYAYDQAYDYNG